MNWVLILYLHGTPDIWGYYGSLEKCQRTISQMSEYYIKKGKKFEAECVSTLPVQLEDKNEKKYINNR